MPIRIAHRVGGFVVLLVVFAACNGSGSTGTPVPVIPTKWNPAASKQVEDVGRRLHATGADAFATTFPASLCQRTANTKKTAKPFPGLPFVAGGTWSIQSDGEPGGRRAAAVLGGRYHFERCPGIGPVGWKDAPAKALNDLAGKLSAGGLGCADFLLADRNSLVPLPAYQAGASGLPAALGNPLRRWAASRASLSGESPENADPRRGCRYGCPSPHCPLETTGETTHGRPS